MVGIENLGALLPFAVQKFVVGIDEDGARYFIRRPENATAATLLRTSRNLATPQTIRSLVRESVHA